METTRELYEKLIIKSRESKDREQGRRYRVMAYCFHPDGYTRERALRTIPDVSSKDLLWIADHRLTDWVSPIRALAAELIDSLGRWDAWYENAREACRYDCDPGVREIWKKHRK